MKKILSSFLLSFALIFAPVVLAGGCKTQSTQHVAFKTLKSVQQASVAALDIYGAAYRRGDIDIATRAKVQELYVKYQKAFSAAVMAARFNYDSASPAELTAAVTELIQLISTFQKP